MHVVKVDPQQPNSLSDVCKSQVPSIKELPVMVELFACTSYTCSDLCYNQICSPRILSKTTTPPFLMRSRPKAIRLNGRVLGISFQGEALLSQLVLVGGNKTGVFVHQVTEGSHAHTVGITPGAQIVEVGLSIILRHSSS